MTSIVITPFDSENTEELKEFLWRVIDIADFNDVLPPSVRLVDVQALEAGRRELTTLRISLARIAQALSVETDRLKVRGKPYEDLSMLAESNERGWNELAGECANAALSLDSGRK